MDLSINVVNNEAISFAKILITIPLSDPNYSPTVSDYSDGFNFSLNTMLAPGTIITPFLDQILSI